ncbi:peptidoglycan DD-metalloendopeptidase family protein [Acidipropionibacterium thoenii]|uniref:peptidoglycan DD-metalloendopeptidase family protein n=1 Tax=Acidipropionibacterium thoenii TaxID=1751 RepID=UPI00041EFF4A|nr:peptidoglycan DD-metalloendopeptidase family protein [Acidipropionibacterium thoenii]
MKDFFATSARQWALTIICALLATPLAMLLTATSSALAPASAAGPPVASPPVDGRVLKGFDPPAQPWGVGHRGVDLAAEVGDPVRTVTPGVVTVAGPVAGTGVVVVQMADGRRTTHQPVTARVEVGQAVAAGQIIATVAAGNHCSRSCLHWGLINGRDYQDPMSLLSGGGGAPVRLYPAGHRPRLLPAIPAADDIGLPMATGAGQPGTLSRPVDGPVSSLFGMRRHPVTGVWKLHDGVDLASPCGTPIRAAATGRVVFSGYQPAWGYRVVVDHGVLAGVRVRTTYNHLSGPGAATGSVVLRGQPVGRVGSTGYSTGCHLHLGMERDGRMVDPLRHLS